MALDHYVSQVHLRNFYSTDFDKKLMHAFRKSDGATFTPKSQDVCRLDEGNTNQYLEDPRLVETFLKDVEPYYNRSVDSLRKGEIDGDVAFAISGFVAYVASCSPTAMRMSSSVAEAMLTATAKVLDNHGEIDSAPDNLGASTLTELLDTGKVRFDVDSYYPQAVAVSNIYEKVMVFGNSKWEILVAPSEIGAFFSSDYPIAIEAVTSGYPNKLIPLAPDLCLRIFPSHKRFRREDELDFGGLEFRRLSVSHRQITDINRLIVRCAEDLVFSCHNERWVRPFVAKNARYRLEASISSVGPIGDGVMIANQEIRRRTSNAA